MLHRLLQIPNSNFDRSPLYEFENETYGLTEGQTRLPHFAFTACPTCK